MIYLSFVQRRVMARFRLIFCSLPLILFGASTSLAANTPEAVREVTIKSNWGGLGTAQETEVTIHQKNGKYYIGRKLVNSDMVEALVSALNEPAIADPDFANLGLTPEWLKDNATSAAVKSAANFVDAAQNQKDLFIKSFNDPEVLHKVVPGLFHFVRTDDYPSAKVVVTFDDGSSLSAESHAWYEFMLPWKLSRNGETSYNADISRAVAALMPKKATNRERLAGQGLDAALAESVMRYIEADWKLLDTENKLSGTLTQIRVAYTVESAEINPYHHPEYGIEWNTKQPHETNLHAILHKTDAPSNYVVALVLRVSNNSTDGVEQFLRSSQAYESAPLSIQWLADYIRQYPKVLFRVSYVHDSSFGDKAMSVFANDMHAIGKDDLSGEVKAQQSQITLLITGIKYAESYWLVFPDKHMILWRYGGPSGLLNWKQADFSTARCSEYQEVGGGCVGAVVSPDGVLIQKLSPD
jgi:hypothetical protein